MGAGCVYTAMAELVLLKKSGDLEEAVVLSDTVRSCPELGSTPAKLATASQMSPAQQSLTLTEHNVSLMLKIRWVPVPRNTGRR